MPSAIGSNQGFAPQQTQIALSSSFSDIQLLSNFDALELQGHVFIDAASDYRASFKLSIIKNGAGVYEIAASDIAGDDYIGSPIMSFQISGNYLQCKMDVASPTSGYVKFNIDTPTPALVGSSSLSIEGSNIVSTVPSNRLPEATLSAIGGVKKPLFVSGYLSTNQTGLVHQTNYTIGFDTVTNDVNNDFNITTHEFTAPSAGVYLVSVSVGVVATADADGVNRTILDVKKNGSLEVVLYDVYNNNAGFIRNKGIGSHVLSLSQGDTLEFGAYASITMINTTDRWYIQGLSNQTYFSILKLSD